jgi:hypothetical protein
MRAGRPATRSGDRHHPPIRSTPSKQRAETMPTSLTICSQQPRRHRLVVPHGHPRLEHDEQVNLLDHCAELDLANMWIAYLPMLIAELRAALQRRSRIREHPWTYPKGLDGTELSQVC